MNPRVFREYDIRGVAERDFPDDFVADLGLAIGEHLYQAGARRITLARDCRVSSPRIHGIVRERLISAGLCVQDIGMVHAPGLYFSVFHLEADGGVMITASHNPEEDNGFKIMRGKSTIFGPEIQALRQRIEARHAGQPSPRVVPGKLDEVDVLTPYIAHIAGNISLGPRRFKVVVDAGNGMGGISCIPILRKLGVEVEPLFCEPDGRFPNHHPDPTVPKNLEALVARLKQTDAEVGIAMDGDADRIGVVDPSGRIVWGDQLLMLFAREILRERPGATFVSEVKCSQVMYDDIAAHGGRAIMWKVGHSLIKTKMKEEKAVLAGEMSGHMFFADRYFGYDDAVYASARVVELLSRSDKPLSGIIDRLPVVHNTPEMRVDCPDDVKFQVVERAREHYRKLHPVIDVDGARINFGGGWGLVRASNTGPVLVLRCEADSKSRLHEICADIESTLAKIKAGVGVGAPSSKAEAS
jgi:phosphomannomutase / phosphoglucomutase